MKRIICLLLTISAIGLAQMVSSPGAPVASPYPVVTDSAPVAWSLGGNAVVNGVLTLNHATLAQVLNVSGLVIGGSYKLEVVQDGTGGVVLSGGLPNPTLPTAGTPAGTSGACTNGTHLEAITFVGPSGESTLGAPSASKTCSGSNQSIPLTSIPVGPAGTTGRNVYRTKANTSTPFFLDCASSPCIADNSTTTYSSSVADASLVTAPPITNTTGGCVWLTPSGAASGAFPIASGVNSLSVISFTYDGTNCLMSQAVGYTAM